ncbi:MAG: radical SAM protein [Dehalococcoidales bacterium]|nr:radical SAM protein [Dehalococcoidales bacterium]
MLGTPYDFFIQMHLTERCNLHCRHCYQTRKVPEMSLEEVTQAIENIKKATDSWVTEYAMEMSPSFHFTGGEPFFRDDLFAILETARERGFATALMSNGTLITPEIAQRLKKEQVSDVQVSLEGMKYVHDRIRGDGSFQKALRGIANLVANDVSTSVNMTLSRLNIDEVEGVVDLAGEMGVNMVTFSRLVSCGRGKELGEAMLTPEELAALYGRLHKVRGKVALSSLDPLYTVSGIAGKIPQADFPVGGCAAGVFGITIAADGGIMPCRRMDLTIGNIKTDSFRQLWAESPVLWALRERSSYHDKCGDCRYWSVCRGCRAVALAYARADGVEDYLGADPQCPYFKSNG